MSNEDHMRNGQLKAAYNLQISTNKQFILHYSIHPNPTDTKTLESHLKGFEDRYHKVPKELVADAGASVPLVPKTVSSASQREAFELADKIVCPGNPPATRLYRLTILNK
ncbi:hypothetical protein HER18_04990 [Chryseobacterium sp. NEB161]|nr:hypothetical protein HER18_04990 [Chryseobacterium sp. NEB161]